MSDLVRSAATAILFVLSSAVSAGAAQLIMIDDKGCPYCRQWNREVGATYSANPLGRIAPLRRVYGYKSWPADLKHIGGDNFTPTFILIDKGREIGRFHGYLGKEWFWNRLRRLQAKLK